MWRAAGGVKGRGRAVGCATGGKGGGGVGEERWAVLGRRRSLLGVTLAIHAMSRTLTMSDRLGVGRAYLPIISCSHLS